MNWTSDKIKHYNLSFKFGRYGSIVGFVIVILLGGINEVFHDLLLKKGVPEWNDMKANCIGAWDGMTFKRHKFNN